MSTDLLSLTQGGKEYMSFMSQSLGLIADLDLGTEHLRFMGGQYVVFTLLACVSLTNVPVQAFPRWLHLRT